jgi:hypothetical protein
MSVFSENLAVLERRWPELAGRLGGSTLEISGIEVAGSASGRPYLRLADGTPLEDAADPGASARASLSTVPRETRLLLIKGLGLGTLLKAATARREIERLFAWEPQIALFSLMMRITDLRRVLDDPRLDLFVGDEIDTAMRILRKSHDYGTDASAQLVVLPRHAVLRSPVMALSAEVERRFDEAFAALALVSDRNTATLGRFVDLWRENLVANIPAILDATPVARLAGAARGRAGILVGAGPSLDRNIGPLREYADRGVIACVDTAYRTLRAAGIIPDFVVAVDATEANIRDFDGLDDADGRTALVMVPVVDPAIPRFFRRRIVASYGHPIQQGMEEALGERFGSLLVSGSVATIAYDLLRHLGARPIVVVGMDLAYGVASHTRGVFERVVVDRFRTREDAARRSTRSGEIRREGWGGGEVRTTEQMARWADWFEREIERRPWPTVNATEGGIRIKGMPEERLAAVLGRLGRPRAKAPIAAPAFDAAARGRVLTCLRGLLDEKSDPAALNRLLRWESAVRTPAEVDGARQCLIEKLRRLTGV